MSDEKMLELRACLLRQTGDMLDQIFIITETEELEDMPEEVREIVDMVEDLAGLVRQYL